MEKVCHIPRRYRNSFLSHREYSGAPLPPFKRRLIDHRLTGRPLSSSPSPPAPVTGHHRAPADCNDAIRGDAGADSGRRLRPGCPAGSTATAAAASGRLDAASRRRPAASVPASDGDGWGGGGVTPERGGGVNSPADIRCSHPVNSRLVAGRPGGSESVAGAAQHWRSSALAQLFVRSVVWEQSLISAVWLQSLTRGLSVLVTN